MSKQFKLKFENHFEVQEEKVKHYEFRNKPFSNSDVFLSTVQNFKILSKGEDVKKVYNVRLSRKNFEYNFLPGDTIGILPRNNDREVKEFLNRLNIDCHREEIYVLEILEKTAKKNPLPKHIPNKGILEDIFIYYIDIRKPPKKLFLKALIPFTTSCDEIQLLKKICGPSGSKEYGDLISEEAQTLLGLLNKFPSCNPPIEIILEHSLPLQPRYYSASSSPLQTNTLEITFFIVENSDGTKGVCTGWLEELINKFDKETEIVPIYFRKPNNFRIPTNLSTKLLMICAGTGIAPFIGFLDHLLLTKKRDNWELGNTYLYYGCRYADRDFLYQDELTNYLNEGILTKLYTAFSRTTNKKWYVQDEIDKNGEEFINNVLANKSVIYVCGDTKTVVKGVTDAVIRNLVVHGHLGESAAKDFLNGLVKENRFITDCWS